MKRIAVYVIYDNSGTVQDYLRFQLTELNRAVDRLIVAVNGELGSGEAEKLLSITQELVLRRNEGFDFGAWREIISDRLSRGELEDCDELILMNDTCFGPVYPFETVLKKMESKQLDFWGLTDHAAFREPFWGNENLYGFCPRHIQSYFLAIRKNMFLSDAFLQFWQELPSAETVEECVDRNETVFTKYFEDLGFSWGTYVELTELDRDSDTEKALLSNYSIHAADLLLRRGCPLIKKKVFSAVDRHINGSNGEISSQVLQYLNEHTDYDTGLIVRYLLKSQHLDTVRRALNLNYILEGKSLPDESRVRRAAVFVFTEQQMAMAEHAYKIHQIAERTDVFFVGRTSAHEAADIFGRVKQITADEIKELAIAYDYVCFLHGLNDGTDMAALCISNEKLAFDNLLGSAEYVESIIATFDSDSFLGVLVPPLQKRNLDYLQRDSITGWRGCLGDTGLFLRKMGIKPMLSEQDRNLMSSMCCWCRGTVLAELLSEYGSVEERVWFNSIPFIAQSKGYYTGVGMTELYARISINNYYFDLLEQP